MESFSSKILSNKIFKAKCVHDFSFLIQQDENEDIVQNSECLQLINFVFIFCITTMFFFYLFIHLFRFNQDLIVYFAILF
uniref:Uncharacterized protein n=1 Tax=Octopus bimaculoides TaxID=37653 RepID=A0A0L8H9Q9_OCTBM